MIKNRPILQVCFDVIMRFLRCFVYIYPAHISANQAGIFVTERYNPNLLFYHSQWN